MILSLLLTLIHAALGCNQTGFTVCWSAIHGYLEPTHSQGVFPVYNDETLNKICLMLEPAIQCSKSLKSACSSENKKMLAGVSGTEMAAEFLCGDGMEVYKRERDCYHKPEVIHGGTICNHTYMNSMDNLPNVQGTFKEKHVALCRYMDTLVECVSEVTKTQCNAEAGEWIATIKTILLTPTKIHADCSVEEMPSTKIAPSTVFGIIVGVLLSVLCIVTVALVYRRYQVKHFAQSGKYPVTSRTSCAMSRTYNGHRPSMSTMPANSTAPLLLDSSANNNKETPIVNGKSVTQGRGSLGAKKGKDYTALTDIRSQESFVTSIDESREQGISVHTKDKGISLNVQIAQSNNIMSLML